MPLSWVVLSRTIHDKSGLIQDKHYYIQNWMKTSDKVWPLVVALADSTAGLPVGAAGVFTVTGTIFSQRITLPKTFKNCGWFMQVVNHLVTLVRIFLSDGSNTLKWVNVARANHWPDWWSRALNDSKWFQIMQSKECDPTCEPTNNSTYILKRQQCSGSDSHVSQGDTLPNQKRSWFQSLIQNL